MASKRTKKVASAGMLFGDIYAVVVFIDPARGTGDATDRLKTIVEAGNESRADMPLELSSMQIFRIQPTALVERLLADGNIMTTLAMTFGMISLALATAGAGATPMAYAVIGGATSSTILTPVVVPVVLSCIDSLMRRLSGTRQGRAGQEDLQSSGSRDAGS